MTGGYTAFIRAFIARPTTLRPDEALDAAQELIEADGLAAFTMRRLATHLGVNPMTIYLRFSGKEELLERLLERALLNSELPPVIGETWEEKAVSLARAVRQHLLAHRPLFPLLRSSPYVTTALFQAAQVGLDLMAELGCGPDEAVADFRALLWTTIGFTLLYDVIAERSPSEDEDPAVRWRSALQYASDGALPTFFRYMPHFGPFDQDELFDQIVGAVVAGLARRAPARPACDPGGTTP